MTEPKPTKPLKRAVDLMVFWFKRIGFEAEPGALEGIINLRPSNNLESKQNAEVLWMQEIPDFRRLEEYRWNPVRLKLQFPGGQPARYVVLLNKSATGGIFIWTRGISSWLSKHDQDFRRSGWISLPRERPEDFKGRWMLYLPVDFTTPLEALTLAMTFDGHVMDPEESRKHIVYMDQMRGAGESPPQTIDPGSG